VVTWVWWDQPVVGMEVGTWVLQVVKRMNKTRKGRKRDILVGFSGNIGLSFSFKHYVNLDLHQLTQSERC